MSCLVSWNDACPYNSMTQSFRASNSECSNPYYIPIILSWVQVPEVRQGLPLQSAGVGRPKDAHINEAMVCLETALYFLKIAIAPCTAHIQVYVLLSTMNHSCAPSVRLDTSANSGAEAEAKTGMKCMNCFQDSCASHSQIRLGKADCSWLSLDLAQILFVTFLISNIHCP